MQPLEKISDERMAGGIRKSRSKVWDFFYLAAPNKVVCLLCSQQLSFARSTSGMIRHLKSKHPGMQKISSHVPTGPDGSTRQAELDESLVNVVVRDLQPFSVVDDQGFREFVNKLDPSYILPSQKALKAMVARQHSITREKVMSEVQRSRFVSLTSDVWTSANTDACLAVTCHFVTEESKLCTVFLGISKFPKTCTVVHLEEAQRKLMAMWDISDKVTALVTINSANMVESVQQLGIRHVPCFAHMLNLVVKESLEKTLGLEEIRKRARRIVDFFKSSISAKERLAEMQEQLREPKLKLIQEVDTRWNSTFSMLERLFQQREPVTAALASLNADVLPLSEPDYEAIQQCLGVLEPIHLATIELSAEQRVSASKVIPLIRMLQHVLAEKKAGIDHPTAAQLAENIQDNLQEKCGTVESFQVLSLSTLLDPRFKVLAFGCQRKAKEAVNHLTSECAYLIRATAVEDVLNPSSSKDASALQTPPTKSTLSLTPTSSSLWEMFDSKVSATQSTCTTTTDATAEVQRYLSAAYLDRLDDPMDYWARHSDTYPHLFQLARQYLCIPATSVPCERVFFQGSGSNKKRSHLSPNIVEQIMFLNKNKFRLV